MKKKYKNKKDKNSHHSKNYLVCFSKKTSEIIKSIVNASDEKNALRIALNRLCKIHPEIDISRARVACVFDAGKKRIVKRIGLDS